MNHIKTDLGIPLRFRLKSSRSRKAYAEFFNLDLLKQYDVELKKNFEKLEQQRLQQIEEFRNTALFCATRTNDNLLMWAHYAEQHTGAVLGFKPDLERGSIFRFMKDVKYTNVIIPGKEGPDGPDIGFLRLPLDKVVELEATSTFRNLDYTALLLQENPTPAKYGFDGIIGILAERTKKIKMELGIRMEFESRYQFGTTVPLPNAHGLDRCLFTPGPTDIIPYPESYGGTSGGGLWRTYCHVDAEGKQQVAENRLVGVAYYQSEKVGAKRLLYCHGPRTIYELLLGKIKDTWPDAKVM